MTGVMITAHPRVLKIQAIGVDMDGKAGVVDTHPRVLKIQAIGVDTDGKAGVVDTTITRRSAMIAVAGASATAVSVY
jgi:hypothetical protein